MAGLVLVLVTFGVSQALGQAALRPGTDVQADAPLPDKIFPTTKTNEPTIAVNPTNAKNVIAGANDEMGEPGCTGSVEDGTISCPFVNDVPVSGVDTSFDGGTTWSQQLLDFTPIGRFAFGDPVVRFDADGNAYFASLAFRLGTDLASPSFAQSADVAIAKSFDGGRTWPLVTLVNAGNPAAFDDKEWLAVDARRGSPHRGNVYVSWSLFQGSSIWMVVSTSRDGGQSFSAPVVLRRGAPFRQGSMVVVSPRGDAYVVWRDVDERRIPRVVHMFAVSRDGGRTFSAPRIISGVTEIPDPLPNMTFRNNSFPAIAVDDEGAIYVVWADYRSGNAEILLVKSTDGGTTWSSPRVVRARPATDELFPNITIGRRGAVALVYYSREDAPGLPKPRNCSACAHGSLLSTLVALSTDGGQSFSEVLVSDVKSDPEVSSTNSLAVQFMGDYLDIAATDRELLPIWTDTRNGSPVLTTANLGKFGRTDILLDRVRY